jgi:hypothetical protein
MVTPRQSGVPPSAEGGDRLSKDIRRPVAELTGWVLQGRLALAAIRERGGTAGRHMRMTCWSRSLFVIVLAGSMAACGGRSAPSGSGSAAVTGTVTAGPTCPVERAGSPCPNRAVDGASVQADRGGHVVAETLTGAHGRYTLTVTPGVYQIIATNAGGYRSIARQRVSLAAGERQTVDLVVDTGIR